MMDVPEANHCIPLWYLRVNSFFFRWNNGSRSAPSVDQKPWKQGNHPNNMDRIGSKGWHNLPGTFGLLKDDHLLCPPGGVSKGTCSTRTCGKFQVDVMFVCDQKISKYIIYIYIYVCILLYTAFDLWCSCSTLSSLLLFKSRLFHAAQRSAWAKCTSQDISRAGNRSTGGTAQTSSVQSQKCHCSNSQSIWYQWVYSYIPLVNYRML